MSKKKKKSNDRLWDIIEEQDEQVSRIMSMFYPDGTRADFVRALRVGKILKDCYTVTKRFSEDWQAQDKCRHIAENANRRGYPYMDIDFSRSVLTFQSTTCVEFNACALFKAAPDDISIYLKSGYENENTLLRFLIDRNEKQAFAVLEDRDIRNKGEVFADNASFILLPEFHAIITGTKGNCKRDNNTRNDLCYMVSHSQAAGLCVAEQYYTYDANSCPLERLFPPPEPGR